MQPSAVSCVVAIVLCQGDYDVLCRLRSADRLRPCPRAGLHRLGGLPRTAPAQARDGRPRLTAERPFFSAEALGRQAPGLSPFADPLLECGLDVLTGP